jgi:hypothetical protein
MVKEGELRNPLNPTNLKVEEDQARSKKLEEGRGSW